MFVRTKHSNFYNVLNMQIIEQFQKCHLDHPIAKFFGECTDLKIKLDRCFRQEVSFLHLGFLFSFLIGMSVRNLNLRVISLFSFTESFEAKG